MQTDHELVDNADSVGIDTLHAVTMATVVLGLDGDAAGRNAAIAAGQRLRAAGADVRIAALPNGIDPAEYLTQATSNLNTFTASHAVPLLAVTVQQAIAAQGERMQWVEGRLGAARVIAKNLSTYPVGHAAKQIGWIAHTLDLDSGTFTLEVTNAYDKAGRIERPLQQLEVPARESIHRRAAHYQMP